MMAWAAVDVAWWPDVVDMLHGSGAAWTDGAIFADLRWWDDQERRGIQRIPRAPQLAERWGVSVKVARHRMSQEAVWRSPLEVHQRPKRAPAKDAGHNEGTGGNIEGTGGHEEGTPDLGTTPTIEGEGHNEGTGGHEEGTGGHQKGHAGVVLRRREEEEGDTDIDVPPEGDTQVLDAEPASPASKPKRKTGATQEAVQRTWQHYRSARIAAGCGTEAIGATPPSDFRKAIASALRDRSEGEVLLGVDWYFLAPDAAWWRQRKGSTPTPFFGATWVKTGEMARQWHAAGRPIATAAPASDTSAATDAWRSLPPQWHRPRRTDAPSSAPGDGRWQLHPDRREHDCRFAAMRSAGGWPAWCTADDFQRRAFEKAWTAAYASHQRSAA